jgi:hypothetical protein
MCGRITKIEHAEMPPLVAARFTAMRVQIERVNSDDADADRERDRADHAAHRIRIARLFGWWCH